MKTISVAWLREQGACGDQVATVEAEWGTGEIELSRANLERAVQLMLDLGWLAGATLDGPAWDAYAAAIKPARDAYDAAIKAARDACDAACVTALADALEER